MKLAAGLMAAFMTFGAAHAEKLTPERVFADPDLSGPLAKGVKVSPDGAAVTYLRAKADDQRMTDLWIADVKGGPARLLIDARSLAPQEKALSEAEKSRRERQGRSPSNRMVMKYSAQPSTNQPG